jgi:hypothetical protein
MRLKRMILLLTITIAFSLTAFSQIILTESQSKLIAKDLKRLEFCDSISITKSIQIAGYKNQVIIINNSMDKALLKIKIRGLTLRFGIPLVFIGGFYLGFKMY